ncbi:MAG: hypothetical protein WED05_10830 [Candidatus Atabeyarchaeum deiterrae]
MSEDDESEERDQFEAPPRPLRLFENDRIHGDKAIFDKSWHGSRGGQGIEAYRDPEHVLARKDADDVKISIAKEKRFLAFSVAMTVLGALIATWSLVFQPAIYFTMYVAGSLEPASVVPFWIILLGLGLAAIFGLTSISTARSISDMKVVEEEEKKFTRSARN